MKRVLFLFCLLFLTTALSAQKVLYVSSNGSDTWTGSRTQPFQTVHKALEQSGVTEVRVAVGNYKISIHEKGEIYVPAGVVVKGGYKEKAPHEVQDALVENRGVVAGQSVFQGDSTCRIFEVAGGLEQVTVTGGRAEGGNGGGVFVKSGGVVKNCIIWGNQAAGKAPKVGDLLMKNGDCMDVSLFTYEQKDDVEGVVFWVNPQRDAPKGERGRAVGIKTVSGFWLKPPGYFGTSLVEVDVSFPDFMPYVSSPASALTDVDGDINTTKILAASADFEYPLAEACRDLGSDWYLPAIGEVMYIMAEWSVVDDTFGILWDKIQVGCGGSRTFMQNYFGCSSTDAVLSWKETSVLLHTKTANIVSSSCVTKSEVWRLGSFTNASVLEIWSLYDKLGKKYRFTTVQSFSVRKF